MNYNKDLFGKIIVLNNTAKFGFAIWTEFFDARPSFNADITEFMSASIESTRDYTIC